MNGINNDSVDYKLILTSGQIALDTQTESVVVSGIKTLD